MSLFRRCLISVPALTVLLVACGQDKKVPAAGSTQQVSSQGSSVFQQAFDTYPTTPATINSFTSPSGRVVKYATFGNLNGTPVLLLNGSTGSAASLDMISAYRSTIQNLNVFFVSPDRTGFGETPYDPTITPDQYAMDWVSLMDSFGYQKFTVLAVSAGGFYAAHLTTQYPEKIKQLHLVSANDSSGNNPVFCPTPTPQYWLGTLQFLLIDPSSFVYLLSTRDLAYLDSIPGSLNWFISVDVPTLADPIDHQDKGLAHDSYLFCNFTLNAADFAQTTFPTFVYHGVIDSTVPISVADNNASLYKNVVSFRKYNNDSHFIFLRHLGQVLLDIKDAKAKTLVCHTGTNEVIVGNSAEQNHLDHGDTLDICAWNGTSGQ